MTVCFLYTLHFIFPIPWPQQIDATVVCCSSQAPVERRWVKNQKRLTKKNQKRQTCPKNQFFYNFFLKYVDLNVFLNFNKIKSLTDNIKDIANSIQSSDLLQLTECGTKVCRVKPLEQNQNYDECTIYVENIPAKTDHDFLSVVFSVYGEIDYVSIPRFKISKKNKGFAFIEFKEPESVEKAITSGKADKQSSSSSQSSSSAVKDKVPQQTTSTASKQGSASEPARPLSPAVISGIENNFVLKILNDSNVYNKLVKDVVSGVSSLVIEGLTASLNSAILQIVDLQKEVSSLKEQLKLSDEKVKQSFDRADNLEQYQRRNCIRIFGVPEANKEDTDQLVIDVCKDKLGVNIELQDIDRSHRVGRRLAVAASNTPPPRPRAIIVKFVSYRQRYAVFSQKKKLKGTGVVIREDLTQRRIQLYNSMVEKFGYKNVWSFDGIIYWTDTEGKKHSAANHV
ncbi:la-related protein 7-like [Nilaparvata lugens]|uniref:la-related protein 7-like n=1 Tax=Nilaparvata lugens TaxID=108931 RepID=UPI00193D56B7|nr:la-related protein 7-like [Nilaparvata lugens]